MAQDSDAFRLKHPVFFGRLRNWFVLLRREKVDRGYIGRLLIILATSALTLPFRMYESARYGKQVRSVEIEKPPIFIVGHPRSGTTHLHNLMCQDLNMGYVTTLQASAPEMFLGAGSVLRLLLRRVLPGSRVSDRIPLLLDGPQEEEWAVYNMSPHSFFYHLFFPKSGEYYLRYALFRNVSAVTIAEWKKTYLTILQQATLYMKARRLVLKTPMNVGRVDILRELFPEAKFIHIVRNPYDVFVSTKRMYSRLLETTRLQDITERQTVEYILLFYEEMMKKFLRDKTSIPPGNFVSVRFEDVEKDPLSELGRIYDRLRLPGFAEAQPALRTYIAAQSGYRKGGYDLSAEDIDLVNRRWGFAFEAWGYDMLTP
jgi:hypothetical protein